MSTPSQIDRETLASEPAEPMPPRVELAEVDLHRIDQAAWLLAHKDPVPDPDELLAAAASAVRGDRRERGDPVIVVIAAMIDKTTASSRGDAQTREDAAARRLAGLLVALAGAPEAQAIQQSIRRGELETPLPMSSLRKIRRALKASLRGPDPARADVEPLQGLASAAWEALLDVLARSLALDTDDELRRDGALDGRDAAALAARLQGVRAVLANPPPPTPPTADKGAAATAPGGPREPPALGRRLGRFTLLHRLGAGAMGVVYAAYDEQLDRKVAIKVLRALSPRDSARAQLRLLREAQAMARLSHPNVAVVHEVATDGSDVYVAMEFIRGGTVQAWLAEEPRSWSAIVEVFLQAGRGLAAAHAAGLVHRDFKPSNAMIGADGRVRVLDFGLCATGRVSDEDLPTDTAVTRSSSQSVKVTQGGEVVGTPAYMPPEQFRGQDVGPASDQFAFCASLYEALYAQLPFAGETVYDIAKAVSRGEVREPPRGTRVPMWLHGVVLRGLRPDPRDRYPHMEALLRALDRSQVRRRRTWAAALAFAGAAAVGGFVAAKAHSAQDDPCSGGVAEIAGVWNDERRAAAGQALAAAGHAYSEEVWPRVAAALDGYAERWQSEHRDACLAHRRGENSEALLDRRMACLGQRKVALAEAVTLLGEADPTVALHALELAGDLPPLARCSDIAALEAEVPPPGDPETAEQVEALERTLTRVRMLEGGGHEKAAIELAERAVADARKVDYPPALAQALLQRGKLSLNLTARVEPQLELLQGALQTAVAARVDEVAAEAMALVLFVRARIPGMAGRALEDLPLAQAFVARLPNPGRVRGLLLNNAAVATLASGDPARARALFGEALRVKEETYGHQHLEVAYTLSNLAMLDADPAARSSRLRAALDIFEAELGAAHPQTIEARIAASLYTRDPGEARDLLRPGCVALERFELDDGVQRARCQFTLGQHSAEAGALGEAHAAWRKASALLQREAPGGERMPAVESALILAHAALADGAHASAAAALRAAFAEARGDEWWQQRQRAELSLALGLHLRALGEPTSAREALQGAVDGLTGVAATARDVQGEQHLAAARVALASVLVGEASRDSAASAEAHRLLQAAEQWYRDAGATYTWRLEEIGALRRRLPERTAARGDR